MNLDLYKLTVSSRAGAQKALFQSGSPGAGLLSLTFDLARDGGCIRMDLTVDRDHNKGTLAVGDIVTFDAAVGGGALTRYWKGVIVSEPQAGNTNRVWRYEAQGLWDAEVANQIVVKYYEGADVDDVVIDILADIDTPATAVDSSTSEISVASPYTVADIESEYDSAPTIIEQLAVLQGDVQFGVDQNGKLYFKDYDTTDINTFIIGTHLSTINVRRDTDGVVNDVYVQSKEVVGGGNLNLHDEDPTSKGLYCTRTKIVQFRNSKDPDDVARYAASVIARFKDPARVVDTELPGFSTFVFPRGNVRIIDTDGSEYTFPILRVKYTLDKTAGLVGTMEIGDRLLPTLEDSMRDVVRRIEVVKSGVISLAKIDHTDGEEFVQAALIDARKNGFLNTFYDAITDDKVWDRLQSRGVYAYNGDLLDDPASADNFPVVLVSNAIPSGVVPDTVRLATYVDLNGRIEFAHDSDVQLFFETGAGGAPTEWRLSQNAQGMEQWANGNVVYYIETPGGGFTLRANHGFACLVRDAGVVPVGAPYVLMLFGYVDSNNYNYVEWIRGASTLTVDLYKRVAGVDTLQDSIGVTSGIGDYVVRVAYYSGSGHRLEIWDEDDTTLLHNGSYRTLSVPASSRLGLWRWWDATVGVRAYAGWYEVENPQAVVGMPVQISRDDGANYTSGVFPYGGWHGEPKQRFENIDLSSLASGRLLRLKAQFYHPSRLKGWAISW